MATNSPPIRIQFAVANRLSSPLLIFKIQSWPSSTTIWHHLLTQSRVCLCRPTIYSSPLHLIKAHRTAKGKFCVLSSREITFDNQKKKNTFCLYKQTGQRKISRQPKELSFNKENEIRTKMNI